MTLSNQDIRVSTILHVMDEIEKYPLSANQYFKEKEVPFGRVQYYLYKNTIKERGTEGLYDLRIKGNNLKFTTEIEKFVTGLLKYNRSMTSTEIQNAIKNEFEITISNTVINDFRKDNDLIWVRPKKDKAISNESGASEIVIALALETGLLDALTNSICQCLQKKKESDTFKESTSIQKDHLELRTKGQFTAEYNNQPQVRESRFKSLDEKIDNKRFTSMPIFSLTRRSIMRYILALLSLPMVTSNGRVRSVDNPRGNDLKYLCGFNYKAATLDKHLRDLKYLQISNELIETIAKYWMDFWSSRNESSDNIFVCYYIDGNTKALWSSKSCHKGRVTMLGRVMNCLEQVFIHDGQGHPIYFQTFNGHADLGKNALGMMDKISDILRNSTTLDDQFTVNRVMIMDGAGNGVKTLRALSDSDYHFITILDPNQVSDRKIKSVSEEKRYDYGDAHLVDCLIELEDSNDKGYIFEARAVQVHWDNDKTAVLITNLSKELFSIDNVVKSYFDRWPLQELNFKDMKEGVNIHRVAGYGKKLVENTKVVEKTERLQEQISKLERELVGSLNEIGSLEEILPLKIKEERIYRERSTVVKGERKLSEDDAQILKSIQKEINSLKRKIKKIEKEHEKPFKSLKKKKDELARIIDKKKIYHVDVELEQIMTCFRISFVNICCYLLDECFNGEKMTLQRLFEAIFDLRAEVRVEDGQRNIFIERNQKQENLMRKLDSALDVINGKEIEDLNGCRYNFKLVQINAVL